MPIFAIVNIAGGTVKPRAMVLLFILGEPHFGCIRPEIRHADDSHREVGERYSGA
jgi:hypothetical protein